MAKKTKAKVPEKEESSTVPWVEKYRPKKVDDLVYQDEVVKVLKNCVKGADLPNLLFYGPPGTGKTSAAVALCRQLFRTPQIYKDRVLEMNASDERGIDVVRHRIKEFSRVSVSSGKDATVALKVVILDEADAMTGAAQSALRRTMESETQTTRFFLICNYITRIIEPLTSRCAKFRFKPLSMNAQRGRLQYICENEKVDIDEDAVDELVSVTGGDLRKSITLLQSLACTGEQITVDHVKETSGFIPKEQLEAMFEAAKSQDPSKLRRAMREFARQGFSAYQFTHQMADLILEDDSLKAGHQAKIFEKMAECERRLLDGADEYLQLYDLMTTVQGCFFELDSY